MPINNIKNYKHIIWDWNGTLLDDVDIVVDVMNNLLKRRKMPLINKQKYKNIFTFPVKEYYAQLGFNFLIEPFEKLAIEYISEYNNNVYQFKLYDGTEKVLENISNSGISQSILSACQEKDLLKAVSKLNIDEYFINIAGLNNYYAVSKVKRGKDLLTEAGLKPEEVLLIGDTVHDYQVSKELGCHCLLISNGHQSYRRISNCNTNIVRTISDVIEFVNKKANAI